MKRFFAALAVCMMTAVSTFAQYNVGTSTTGRTDMFGNTTTTHRDSYGRSVGSSTTGSTDMFGNTTTQQRSNSGTGIWTW